MLESAPWLLLMIAFITSVCLVFCVGPICVRLDHMDHPGGRKRHRRGTPLSGGIVIVINFVVLGLFSTPSIAFAGFALGVTALGLLGLIDDRQHVPAVIRLGVQVIAVAIGMCAIGGVRLDSLGDLFGNGGVVLSGWAIAFTVFAGVGIINAVNMIDGMDGIAGGFALLSLGVIYLLSLSSGAVDLRSAAIVLGTLCGFLAFNLRTPWRASARIFLGDAGSLVLGYMLVWFSISASQGAVTVFHPITAVWIVGLPLCDTVYLMITRAKRGHNPMSADRFHYHHLLNRIGLVPTRVLMAWLATSAAFMAIGLALDRLGAPSFVSTYIFFLVFVVYSVAVSLCWRWLAYGRRSGSLAKVFSPPRRPSA